MARTYNEIYLDMRRQLKDAGVDDFALEARRLLAQAAGYSDAELIARFYLYANAEDLVKALDRKDVDLIVLDEDIYESLYRPTGQYQVFYVGFLEENYAFGLKKGSTLTEVVNGHLLNMLKDGTAQKIAEGFFSRNYTNTSQAEIVRPTQAPTVIPVIPPVVIPTQAPAPAPAACINSMTFTADVTITSRSWAFSALANSGSMVMLSISIFPLATA